MLLNDKQEEKCPNAPVIVSFAPGFQLDSQAYPHMIQAFNSQNVPVFTSPSLPQGFKALKYNEHPLNLTKALATFMNQLAQARPNTKIIALGHSY